MLLLYMANFSISQTSLFLILNTSISNVVLLPHSTDLCLQVKTVLKTTHTDVESMNQAFTSMLPGSV